MGLHDAGFESRNSLGDALYTTPVIREWHRQNPEFKIEIRTDDNWVKPVYQHMGIPITFSHDQLDDRHYGFYCDLDASKAAEKCDVEGKVGHMADLFASMAGIKLPDNCWCGLPAVHHYHLPEDAVCKSLDTGTHHKFMSARHKPIFIPDPEEVPAELKDCILISPYSHSCITQHGLARKMLPWVLWDLIIRYLRSWHLPIRLLGAPQDRCPLAVSEDEYLTGIPLNRLANIMRQASLLVTVDNGMNHLAASQDCPEFLFYPNALRLDFLLPRYNRNMFFLHVDPERIPAIEMMCALRNNVPKLINREGDK